MESRVKDDIDWQSKIDELEQKIKNMQEVSMKEIESKFGALEAKSLTHETLLFEHGT